MSGNIPSAEEHGEKFQNNLREIPPGGGFLFAFASWNWPLDTKQNLKTSSKSNETPTSKSYGWILRVFKKQSSERNF